MSRTHQLKEILMAENDDAKKQNVATEDPRCSSDVFAPGASSHIRCCSGKAVSNPAGGRGASAVAMQCRSAFDNYRPDHKQRHQAASGAASDKWKSECARLDGAEPDTDAALLQGVQSVRLEANLASRQLDRARPRPDS